ncbi:MAG: helix-turn-helix transcriptional regulator [Stackebrandtia sp.]
MRASRLVSILSLLQIHGLRTARQLADTLDVSVRTIYRDMDSLSRAGIPVYADSGHAGGYRLVGGYRTRLTGLSTGEAESLSLAGLPEVAADLGLGAELAAARLKLLAALPDQLREPARRFTERFHLDAPSWYTDADEAPLLRVVEDAVWRQTRLRIRYSRWSRPHEIDRTVEPYGLVLKTGAWYLVAADLGRMRTYRVSRIRWACAGTDTFVRPDGFDLKRHWAAYLAEFDARRYQWSATVNLSPDAWRQLPYLLEAAAQRAATATASEPDEAGWVTARIPVESTPRAVSQLLAFGAELEILAPEELRAAMADTVAALANRYTGCCGGENVGGGG